jgi:arginyl-tRNA synthetase
MEYVYQWSNIQFDKWYWESDVDSDSVKYIKSLYSQGLLIESQGAIGMDLSEEKLGFCLLLKSDGTGLYATKDIELARRKFQEHKIEKSLYVVDMRQALHFQQVFKVLEKIGFPQAKQCFHLQYNFVELPDGAMSSRKGNIVPLIQLVHRMEKMVKEKYLSRYAGEWTIDEVDLVATQVAQGAIKYGMLRMDSNKKIVFDMEEWLKLDGESGPFIQYAKARIQSLSNKLGYNSTTPVQWSLLVHPAEKKLLQKLMHFQSVIMVATEQYRPSVLCTYLYELAKAFNLFYHEVSIGQAETSQLKNTRLALSQATGAVIDQGLGLLGIPSPLKM